MNFIRIPKGNGKFRTICLPTHEEKERNRAWIKPINELLTMAWRNVPAERNPIHGFTAGRSPVTNAMAHRGKRFTLSFDLKDFFDTVRIDHVEPHLMERDLELFCAACLFSRPMPPGLEETHDSHPIVMGQSPLQGLPASPSICNLAASAMDMDILKLCTDSRFGQLFVYTRYCDDLTFSFDTEDIGKMLEIEVAKIVAAHRFIINESKTRWQCARAGRRIITGVSVGNDIRMTRETRRRIRAGRHQIRTRISGRNRARLAAIARERKANGDTVSLHGLLVSGYRGLKEWSLLRKPKGCQKPVDTKAPVVRTHPAQARDQGVAAASQIPATYSRTIDTHENQNIITTQTKTAQV